MTQHELKLNKILELHEKWLNDEADGKRANLSRANLRDTDLSRADLRGADLDYSCWPLWCGSLNVKIDTRIATQLLYHLMRSVAVSPDVSDEFKAALYTPALMTAANKFHRVDECGEIVPLNKVG